MGKGHTSPKSSLLYVMRPTARAAIAASATVAAGLRFWKSAGRENQRHREAQQSHCKFFHNESFLIFKVSELPKRQALFQIRRTRLRKCKSLVATILSGTMTPEDAVRIGS